MTFEQAVRACPLLRSLYQRGLAALGSHSGCVSCNDPRRLTGSVDLDGATQKAFPDSPRWDYGIGFRPPKGKEVALWIEIHPASSTHVDEVLKKLNWLRDWLDKNAKALQNLTKQGGYYWIAPDGRIAVTPNSPQAKRLAKEGLRGPLRGLKL
ncbi:MAG: hypothetical protein GYA33_12590 [Thermogutta sp.]|nr:hypothetical protein [Thermogutta sp.]